MKDSELWTFRKHLIRCSYGEKRTTSGSPWWCPWRESNPHSLRNTIFKSCASTSSATRADGGDIYMDAAGCGHTGPGGLASGRWIGDWRGLWLSPRRPCSKASPTSFATSRAAAALALFAIGPATLLGAWFFQYVLKLPPCPLCLEQRIPFYVVIPLSLLIAIAARCAHPAN